MSVKYGTPRTPEERQKLALKRGDRYYHHGCGEIRETLKIVTNKSNSKPKKPA